MKHILLLLPLLFLQGRLYAQKEANNWYFGDRAGLSFSKGYAEALTDGAMRAVEGCATMSDPETGELLFYTNGIQVWNGQHQVMPNGSGLLSDLSSTQAALIVPSPKHARQYFLFTINSVGVTSGSSNQSTMHALLVRLPSETLHATHTLLPFSFVFSLVASMSVMISVGSSKNFTNGTKR